VEVGGLAVSSGDILFGDSGGLLSVPSSIVAEVPSTVEQLRRQESRIIAFCRSAEFSIAGLRALVRDLA
jgi:regulator of RNase E activity RraA